MKRPIIKIELNAFDKTVEALCILMLISIWAVALNYYPNLPDTIPTHFNAAGVIDDYGSKITIFLLPGIYSILFILLSVLNFFPHIFNYTKEITPENALAQYSIATQMLRVLKLTIGVVFFIISYGTIQSALASGEFFGIWLLPLILTMLLAPVIYYVIKASKS